MAGIRAGSLPFQVSLVVMFTTSAALLISIAVLLISEQRSYEARVASQLATEGEIVAANSEAALVFDDSDAGAEALNALTEAPHVLVATLRSTDGDVFAQYVREGAASEDRHAEENLVTRLPVVADEEPVGTLELVADREILYAGLRSRFTMIVSVVGIVLFGALLVSLRLGRSVVRPVVDLMRVAEKVTAANDYSVRARSEVRGEVGGLISAFNHMLGEIEGRDNALKSANVAIRAKESELALILHSLNQGVFTVDTSGKIVGEHSRKAEILFGCEDFGSVALGDLLRAEQGDIDLLNQWISLMGDERFRRRWTRNLKLNPLTETEFRVNGDRRVIELDYQPVTSADGESLERVLVLATDVTAARDAQQVLAREQREHELEMGRILALAGNERTSVEATIRVTDELCRALRAAELETLGGEEIEELYRTVHTIKGNAGTLGFGGISAVAGDIEAAFDRRRPDSRGIAVAEDTWSGVLSSLEAELDAVGKVRQRLFGSRLDQIVVSRARFAAVLKELRADPATDHGQLLRRVQALDAVEFASLRSKYERLVAYYSETRGKEIAPLLFESAGAWLARETISVLDDCVGHLIRNSLDHGIEPDATRRELGKGPGLIAVEYRREQGRHVVSVSDDGGGVDTRRLSELAAERGLVTASELAMMNKQERLRLAFLPGLSSARNVTEISGKGRGMSAVIEMIEAHNGGFDFISEPGKRTIVTIWLPASEGADDGSDVAVAS